MADLMDAEMMPWLLLAVPCAGALLTAFAWSTLRELKTVLLLTAVAGLLTVIGAAVAIETPPRGMPLLCVLPLAAFASLLGQPLHRDNRKAWLTTVVILGLGMAVVAAPQTLKAALLGLFLLFMAALLAHSRSGTDPAPAWGVATYGLGAVSALVSVLAPAPVSFIGALLSSLVLLPLFPLHAGYVACLTRLPGNLPAFLALALPVAGFSHLLVLVPALSDPTRGVIVGLALTSMVYGSARALAQIRPLPLLAHGSLAFYSMVWWSAGVDGAISPSSAVFLCAVGLATGGLYLGWYAVRARFGDVDLRALGGLVQPMPRFAGLYSLLALAALGLPPFGVFSGFMGMVLNPDRALPGSFALVVLAWLAASWYFLDLMRHLLFGRSRADLRYEDVRQTEFASLTLLLVLLMVLGVIPSRWFDAGAAPRPSPASLESSAWTR